MIINIQRLYLLSRTFYWVTNLLLILNISTSQGRVQNPYAENDATVQPIPAELYKRQSRPHKYFSEECTPQVLDTQPMLARGWLIKFIMPLSWRLSVSLTFIMLSRISGVGKSRCWWQHRISILCFYRLCTWVLILWCLHRCICGPISGWWKKRWRGRGRQGWWNISFYFL